MAFDVEVEKPGPKRGKRDGKVTARKFVELVRDQQKTPQEAASILNLDMKTLSTGPEFKHYCQILYKNWSAPAEVRREIVRAGLNKVAVESLANGDYETFMTATKQIGSDPEVGLTAPPAPLVSLNIGSLDALMGKLSLEDVIDVTPVESTKDAPDK
jgi:hypothetical protein